MIILLLPRRSIISLIANVSRSSEVLAEVFAVMRDVGVQVNQPGIPAKTYTCHAVRPGVCFLSTHM